MGVKIKKTPQLLNKDLTKLKKKQKQKNKQKKKNKELTKTKCDFKLV